MTHSPEPWTYDERYQEVLDANGRVLAIPTGDYKDANGRRIAALSAENARLRALLAEADTWIECAEYRDTENAVCALEFRQRAALAAQEVQP